MIYRQLFIIMIMLVSFIVPAGAIIDNVGGDSGLYKIYVTTISALYLMTVFVVVIYFSLKMKAHKNELRTQININVANTKKKHVLDFLGLNGKEPLNLCFKWGDAQKMKVWIRHNVYLDKGYVKIEKNEDADNVFYFTGDGDKSAELEIDKKNCTVHLIVNGARDNEIKLIVIEEEKELAVYSIDRKDLINRIEDKIKELFRDNISSAPPVATTVQLPAKDNDKQLITFIDKLKKDLDVHDSNGCADDNIQLIHGKIRDIHHYHKRIRILFKNITSPDGDNTEIDKIEEYVDKCKSLLRAMKELNPLIGNKNVPGNDDIDQYIKNIKNFKDQLKNAKDLDRVNGTLANSFKEFIEYLDEDRSDSLNPASIDDYNIFKMYFRFYARSWNKSSDSKMYLEHIFSNIKILIKKNSILEQQIKQLGPIINEMNKINTDDVVSQLNDIRHNISNIKQSGMKTDTLCSVILDSLDEHLNEMEYQVNTANKLVLSNYRFYYLHIVNMLDHLNTEIPVDDISGTAKSKLESTKNLLDKLVAIKKNPNFMDIHPAIPMHYSELSSKLYKSANESYEEGNFEEALIMSGACRNTVEYTIALYTNNKLADLLRILTNL